MEPIHPPRTLGVLGGGQLGRMFAQAAQRLGYSVGVFTNLEDSPAGRVADLQRCASYDDQPQLEAFAREVEAVTFEFENVPVQSAAVLAPHIPVRPKGELLYVSQNRQREKRTLRSLGLPVAEFAEIETVSDLATAKQSIPGPGLLKTAAFGYDGKGQVRIADASELEAAWDEIGRQVAVLEGLVPFEKEVSVVGVRGVDGDVRLYEPFENQHANQILDLTLWPARVSPKTREGAHEITRTILEGLEVVGVICVELFVLPDGGLVVNEIAPRPHNSGHLTIDAHVASQFEQQVRALAGIPLGSVESTAPAAAMANLLGDLWTDGEPNWNRVHEHPGAHLHLYGKREARPGRKMGHLTVTGESLEDVAERAVELRSALTR